ncbi:MAG: rhomboid family intramembrane serine protease [bacterium]|nr:rhomboid family intramembrane serine protease [bacterium]
MKSNRHPFGSTSEAIIYPVLLLALMWLAHWADHLFPLMKFYQYGVQPGEASSLTGILFMPLIHSKVGFEHIINNSVPIAILLGALIYYYRQVALRVFLISWVATGLGLWLFATNTNSYHIGMSGVIYALAGFLFVSGVLRKYLPLQAISLFVAFIYGSMIWGIFPTESHVSWEGHLSGLVTGVILAFIFRKLGPQAPKYQYEIEREMGIEPPDLEGQWRERIRLEKERQEAIEELKRQRAEQWKAQQEGRPQKHPDESPDPLRVIYTYKPKTPPTPPDDTTEQ